MLEEDLLEPEYSSVQRGAGFAHPGTMARVGIPLLLVQQANWGHNQGDFKSLCLMYLA